MVVVLIDPLGQFHARTPVVQFFFPAPRNRFPVSGSRFPVWICARIFISRQFLEAKAVLNGFISIYVCHRQTMQLWKPTIIYYRRTQTLPRCCAKGLRAKNTWMHLKGPQSRRISSMIVIDECDAREQKGNENEIEYG